MSSESLTSTQESTFARSATVTLPWHRLALAVVLLLAALLNVVELSRVGLGNTYYATAVKSMLTSWHAFFFVSLDPGGFVSIDKPPVAFWVQAASAKIFGFSGLSLLLPEAVAGVLSVLLLYALVARSFGSGAGLLAALALAITPVAVVVDRSNLVESILVLTMLLAAGSALRAAETGRLRWLLAAAALAGLGFNVKMLEAYLAVPAFFVAYMLGAHLRLYVRLWHSLAAVLVLFVVSLSWVTAVDMTPTSQRPYVGSSGDNSELSLALGYNGLGRLTGNTFSFLRSGTSVSDTLSDLSPTNLGFTQGETGSPGLQRLINAELGGQASWLLMLALFGIVVGAWQRRIRVPLQTQHQAVVLWGVWLATGCAFFSVAGFFHAYYLAMIAPPIAALAGIGTALLWSDYRRPGWRGWALPLALLATAVMQAHILSFYPSWSRWLTPLVVGGSGVAALALAVMRIRRASLTVTGVGALIGLVSLLLAPFIWSEYTVAHASANMTPSAGPGGRGSFGGGRPIFATGPRIAFGDAPRLAQPGSPGPGGFPFAGSFGGRFAGPGDRQTVNSKLVRYLVAHQGHVTFLVATFNASEAEPIILATNRPVMDLGGFSGGDRILTPQQLAARVAGGGVRYFLVSAGGRDGFRGALPPGIRQFAERRNRLGGRFGGRNVNNDLTAWIQKRCAVVPARAYGTTPSNATSPAGFDRPGGQQLYDCASATHRAGA